MRIARRTVALALLGSVPVLAACGRSSSPGSQPPSARLEHVGNSANVSVVLTKGGADRIGIETVPVATGPSGPGGPQGAVPYSAVLYELDGSTVLYVNPSPLVYTRVSISVDHISGATAFVNGGPSVGTRVVSVGGEELLGVQDGVQAEG